MHGLNDDSIDWLSSDSIWNYYDKMTKRYLKQHGENDFTKYELTLLGHTPCFKRWDYSEISRPCINRIKKLSNNYYEFDQKARVTFTNQNINSVRHERIHIYTTENKHFKQSSKFMPPSFGFYVTGARNNQMVNVIINPLEVQFISHTYWVFLYKITANKVCTVDIVFHFKYVYYEPSDDLDEVDPVVVATTVQEDDLPDVGNSVTDVSGNAETAETEAEQESLQDIPVEEENIQQQVQPTFRSDDDIMVDKSSLRRSSSLRSSLKRVPVPAQLKDDFQPSTSKTYFAMDKKTLNRLTKK